MRWLAMAAVGLSLVAGSVQAETADADPAQTAVARILVARLEFNRAQYDQAVQAIEPALEPSVFSLLSRPVQYGLLSLYGRAQMRLDDWQAAHETFVDLTLYPGATAQDWSLRMVTALRIGDVRDAMLSRARLTDALSADDRPVA